MSVTSSEAGNRGKTVRSDCWAGWKRLSGGWDWTGENGIYRGGSTRYRLLPATGSAGHGSTYPEINPN
jgi:hypothetical protein